MDHSFDDYNRIINSLVCFMGKLSRSKFPLLNLMSLEAQTLGYITRLLGVWLIIAARIRSMRKGTVFIGVCLSTLVGGGLRTPSQVRTRGGTPIPSLDRGGTQDTPQTGGGYPPSQYWMGYPQSGLDEGTPQIRTGCEYLPPPHSGHDFMGYSPPSRPGMGYPSPIRRQSSKASTCYAVGRMPLAFTQEDFLVQYCNKWNIQ